MAIGTELNSASKPSSRFWTELQKHCHIWQWLVLAAFCYQSYDAEVISLAAFGTAEQMRSVYRQDLSAASRPELMFLSGSTGSSNSVEVYHTIERTGHNERATTCNRLRG
jgi:hypothetical protein